MLKKSIRILARDLKDWPHSHRFLARNLWFQGRISEAFESFKKAEEISEVYKKKFLIILETLYFFQEIVQKLLV